MRPRLRRILTYLFGAEPFFEPEPSPYQEIADYCRWVNHGYKDQQPGTPEDVREYVHRTQHLASLDDRRVRYLLDKVEALEKELRSDT